jgi:hypothetical protein
MATTEERRALLSVTCPWCGSRPNEECRVRGARIRSVTVLDGGAHDARWRIALGRPAPVIGAPVRGRVLEPDEHQRGSVAVMERPVEVPEDRPW